MRHVTMVTDGEDATLWYLDGKYVGHDDQVGERDLMEWLGGEIIRVEEGVLYDVYALETLESLKAALGL